MRTLRFDHHGDPAEVLRLEDTEPPRPGAGQIRVAVQVCGLTPADWALCRGLFAGDLPRGIGLEVAGTVDALGTAVTGVTVGDPVFGPAPFTGPTAGASELTVLDQWFHRPAGLDPTRAAALPMAVETAYRGLDQLGVTAGRTVLIHGAGTTVGFAAVQIALRHGARVIATAGPTYTDALRATGAHVTSYGNGLAERVHALAGGKVDHALDAAPVPDGLPELVRTVAEPGDVLTLSNFDMARELGARGSVGTDTTLRYDVLAEYGRLAAEDRFSVPVARTFPLDDWKAALALSESRRARGKIALQIG